MIKWLLALVLALASSVAFSQSSSTAFTPVVSSAQTAATVNSQDFTNLDYKGGDFLIYVSSYTSGNYTPHIQGKDPASGQYYDILVGAAISSTGMNVIRVCPYCLAIPNVSAQSILPFTWRVQLIGASSPSMTVSVGANLIK